MPFSCFYCSQLQGHEEGRVEQHMGPFEQLVRLARDGLHLDRPILMCRVSNRLAYSGSNFIEKFRQLFHFVPPGSFVMG